MAELSTQDNDRYDRIVAVIRNEVVGVLPAVIPGKIGDLDVLVLCAVVDGRLTDNGKTLVAAEAVLLDGLIGQDLELETGESWEISNG